MMPAIVIVAFNRPKSLSRLLDSISKANYKGLEVPLCICIDHEDSTKNQAVLELATSFEWLYGEKRIIHQSTNQGLKKHVLKCGKLTNDYGSIIMLEDDLTVSPSFYLYAKSALEFYHDRIDVAGVSLYNHRLNFNNAIPFEPLFDGSSVYFMKIASSWGQAWTSRQWLRFEEWFDLNKTIDINSSIPDYVKSWPDSSWLKHFIDYCESNDNHFVYPRVSYTTNWADSGTNNAKQTSYYQVPLAMNVAEFSFVMPELSLARYDSYFELSAEVVKSCCPVLRKFDFEMDLYGQKRKASSKYLISSKVSTKPLMEFGLALKPMELNIINEINGDAFCLAETDTFQQGTGLKFRLFKKETYAYFFGLLPIKEKMKHIKELILQRFKK